MVGCQGSGLVWVFRWYTRPGRGRQEASLTRSLSVVCRLLPTTWMMTAPLVGMVATRLIPKHQLHPGSLQELTSALPRFTIACQIQNPAD